MDSVPALKANAACGKGSLPSFLHLFSRNNALIPLLPGLHGTAWISETRGGSILKSGQPVTSLQLTRAAKMNEDMRRFFREYLLSLDLERLKDRCQSCLL